MEGQPCPHLDGDLCGLMIELGSWNRVHNDKRYKEYPQPVWQARGIADCGDFICDECVVKGG